MSVVSLAKRIDVSTASELKKILTKKLGTILRTKSSGPLTVKVEEGKRNELECRFNITFSNNGKASNFSPSVRYFLANHVKYGLDKDVLFMEIELDNFDFQVVGMEHSLILLECRSFENILKMEVSKFKELLDDIGYYD